MAFVPQEDTLLPFLSVFETVFFSASLRLPWFLPADQKRAKTLAVIDELGLTRVVGPPGASRPLAQGAGWWIVFVDPTNMYPPHN